jgi:hypothetical protein
MWRRLMFDDRMYATGSAPSASVSKSGSAPARLQAAKRLRPWVETHGYQRRDAAKLADVGGVLRKQLAVPLNHPAVYLQQSCR